MSEEDFYSGLVSEKYNYEAKIVPRDKISDVIKTKIIEKAKKFVSLITPYWTWAGIRDLELIPLLRRKLKNQVKIYLFSRYEATPKEDYNDNLEIFKYILSNLGIINCWLIRNLHGKLYLIIICKLYNY